MMPDGRLRRPAAGGSGSMACTTSAAITPGEVSRRESGPEALEPGSEHRVRKAHRPFRRAIEMGDGLEQSVEAFARKARTADDEVARADVAQIALVDHEDAGVVTRVAGNDRTGRDQQHR